MGDEPFAAVLHVNSGETTDVICPVAIGDDRGAFRGQDLGGQFPDGIGGDFQGAALAAREDPGEKLSDGGTASRNLPFAIDPLGIFGEQGGQSLRTTLIVDAGIGGDAFRDDGGFGRGLRLRSGCHGGLFLGAQGRRGGQNDGGSNLSDEYYDGRSRKMRCL